MLQSLRNIRIRNKLFLAYSSAFLLAFIVAGGIIYAQVRTIIQQSIERDLTNATETILAMVRTTADVSIKNYMRAVADKNYEIARQLHRQVKRGRMTEEEAKRLARQAFLSQSIGKTGRIYCLDSDGVMVVHSKRSLVGVDLSGLPFVKEQITSKQGYMEYDWKEPLEKEGRPKAISMRYFQPWDWIISASSYRDEFNELVNIRDFRKRILDLKFGESGYPFVMDYEGNILIHPSLEGKNFTKSDNPRIREITQRIMREKNGKFDYLWLDPGDAKMKRKLLLFNDIPEMGWIVASSSYYDEFYSPLDDIGFVILSVLATMLLLMVPISIWIGSMISRPLKSLQASFAQAADGDFSVRMSLRSRDELGLLAEYFNSFMEELTRYSNDLRDEIVVRQKAEKELIALDKAKTLFLSAASHELRTPLTSIIGFLKLMEKNFNKQFLPCLKALENVGPSATRFVDNLAIVRSEADRLGRLVNDLLDLNKIESDRMEWRDQPLKVEAVMKNVADAISGHVAENPEVDFVFEVPSDLPSFTADADRIHQVLINLLNNALKYTDKGHVTLSASKTQEGVEFSIRDTGRGIPEEYLDKVFDIFYQVQDENMRSSKVFGTGLGLAICRQIATHYGGQISVDSTVGIGSCFRFSIPYSIEKD
ncbi:MAG: cache domain-containing protein [Pseudodesulfovibrio sp.]